MARMSVTEMLVDVLAEMGVRHVFGIPGDAINDLVDAIRRQDVIQFIKVRHEEAGAFAASAQAKLTGELAVCVGTAGGGAIHLLNGLYDAKMDHAPVLAVTGQVPTAHIGNDYHQEVDLYTLFKDVAAFNQQVMTPAQMHHLVGQACQIAMARRTVTHLSLPLDIAGEPVPHADRRHPMYQHAGHTVPSAGELDRAADVLNDAGRVVILAGVGCLNATEELISVAESLGAPIIRSLRGKGVLSDNHPLSLGGLGMLGTRPAVDAIMDCDALLMVGTDFPYEEFLPKPVPAVQIDRDVLRLGKRYPVSVGLVGDAAGTLSALGQRLRRKEDRDFLESSKKAMSKWLEEQEEDERDESVPIKPQLLARMVGDVARDDTVFTCDTGTVTAWCARHLRIHKGQMFSLSASLGSMAYALPAAIGAQLRFPDRQVVAMTGDGGFSMLMADFLTAVDYDLPITVVIFNNSKLGLIKGEQEAKGIPEFQTDLRNPDFAEYARLCGGEGYRVSEPGDLEEALSRAMNSNKPAVVDVLVSPDELPMPPRIGLDQAVGYGVAKAKEWLQG